MIYVLAIVTVFSTSQGIATDTRFHEFASRAACETARNGIRQGVSGINGQMGREVFADCFEKG